jgi:hypothetical protein
MQWSKVSKVGKTDLPLYDYNIRDLAGTRQDCREQYSTIWQLIIRDVLPVAASYPWRVIEAYFRMEDGGSGIHFKASEQEYIDAIPPVGISNGILCDEVDRIGLALEIGEISESEMQRSWDAISLAYAQIILESALDAGLPGKIDEAHRPFTFQILCYESVILEHEIR